MREMMESEVKKSAWVMDYEWVGIVHPQDKKSTVTFITPLASYDNREGWQAISKDEREEYFRNNGKVTYFTRDFPEQDVNRLYYFHPEYNQKDLSGEGSSGIRDDKLSLYLTRGESTSVLSPLAQVFDWSSEACNLFDLPARLERGIEAGECLSRTIFIRYQDRLYGPLHLEADSENTQLLKPRKYRQASSVGGPLLLLNGYPFVRERVLLLENRQFIDQQTLGLAVAKVDWSLPQATIKHVLEASNNMVGVEEQVRLVDKRLKELARLSSSSGPQSLKIETCVLQRAQYIVQHQLERLGNLQSLIEDLSPTHPLMQAASALEIQRRSEEIEQDAARQAEAELQRLGKLQQDAARQSETELQRLQNEVQGAQEDLERLCTDAATLERFMQERLAELRQELLHLFADLQLPVGLPSAFFPTPAALPAEQPQKAVAAQAAPQTVFFTESATNISNVYRLPWKAASEKGGIDMEEPARICAAAFLSGLIPVIVEPASRAVLHTVSRVLTGGRFWTVPVPLTALSPLDLFGHIITDQRMFVPTAGDLADIILEAQAHPDQLGVVLLEGVDRVPFLPVIAPLLHLYRSLPHQAQHAEPLRLFHPRALVADEPYQALAQLRWPINLLLSVTLDQEVGSFPLPESYASWFAQINASKQLTIIDPGEREFWQVPSADWQRWKQEMGDRITHQPVSKYPPELEQWQRFFYQALGLFNIQNKHVDIIKRLWPQAKCDQGSKEKVR